MSVLKNVQTGTGRKLNSQTYATSNNQSKSSPESSILQLKLEGKVVALLQEICFSSLHSRDATIRVVAAETLGRLAKIISTSPISTVPSPGANVSGPASQGSTTLQSSINVPLNGKYVPDLMKGLIDAILSASRDPYLRAGLSMALANILKFVGSMTTNATLLRNVIGVLQTLITDGTVIVYSWALVAFWMVVDIVGVNIRSIQNLLEDNAGIISCIWT